MSNFSSCPVLADGQRVANLSNDLTKALRKLKRASKACLACEAGPDCPIKASWTEQITIAIQEVTEEWNLAQVIM
jgi:hypothetical protein